MLIAGEIATISGVIIACIFIVIAMIIAFPNLFSASAAAPVLEGGTAQPSKLLAMILGTAIFGNVLVSSFITIVVSYAGKKDQTEDKPVQLETDIKPDPNRAVL